MKTRSLPIRIVFLIGSVCLAGCSGDLFHSDRDALDTFSHAYTAFLDAGQDAENASLSIGSEDDPFGFWKEFKKALAVDVQTPDSIRLVRAQVAIAVYERRMPQNQASEEEATEKLDTAVQKLFETANAIHTEDYRKDAVHVAGYAREAQAAFASGQELLVRLARLRRETLDDIVSAGGNLRRALTAASEQTRIGQSEGLNQQIQEVAEKSTTAMRNLKDTFSALKGKTDLPVYPTKADAQENMAQKGGR